MVENDKKFQMKYTIATNFDPELIEEIAKYNQDHTFGSVFGKLKKDIIGGGRSSINLPKVSKNELKDYIQLCHRNHLKFNYLLNPICLGNREFIRKEHRQILKFLESLSNAEVDTVTINSPYLCELLKQQFPNFKITIGHFAYVSTIQQIKYWEELGADEITLQHQTNRNFKLLEDMLQYTKKSGIGLRIIGNNFCLHDCPYSFYHATGLAHSSDKKQKLNQLYIDYNVIRCNTEKIKDPGKLLSSGWVRPEDVKYYEALSEKTGNYNFSIKLVDRTKTTEFLKRVVKAYAFHSYTGNLIDILNLGITSNIRHYDIKTLIIGIITGSYNPKIMRKYADGFNLPVPYMDNQKLDGFIEKFIHEYNCDHSVCGDYDATQPETNDSKECNYCQHWARTVVTQNETADREWLEKSEGFLSDLKHSRMFQ
jgi:collagenase-like PrtC family protease